MTTISLRFNTPNGEYPGARHCDYFKDRGLARAEAVSTIAEAHKVLTATYLGPDVDGIGLSWDIMENN